MVLVDDKQVEPSPPFPQPVRRTNLNTAGMPERTPTGQFMPGHTGNPVSRPGYRPKCGRDCQRYRFRPCRCLLARCEAMMHG